MSLLWASQSDASVIFFDDFNAGASSAWGNERGTWRDSGGVYDATFPNNSPLTYSSVTTLPGLTDFAVDVDINSFNDGGLWLRSNFNSGSINGILLVTGGNIGTFNGLYWHIVTNGNAGGSLAAAAQGGLQGSNSHVRVEVIGNTYTAYLNGSSTAFTSISTNAFGSGSVGLYDFSPVSGGSNPRGQTFDNFQVTDLSAVPEPTSMALLGLASLGGIGLRLGQRRKALAA